MKIRSGFVSNSSSSSFVVTQKMTTAEVACLMCLLLVEDFKKTWGQTHEKAIEAIMWLRDHLDYDQPILIPWTTNYETFIWKIDNHIYVDTCNNQPWWDLEIQIRFIPEEEYIPYYESIEFLDLEDIEAKSLTAKEWKKQYREKLERRWNKNNEN